MWNRCGRLFRRGAAAAVRRSSSSEGQEVAVDVAKIEKKILEELKLESEAGKYFTMLLTSKAVYGAVGGFFALRYVDKALESSSENYKIVRHYVSNHMLADIRWSVEEAPGRVLNRVLGPPIVTRDDEWLEDFLYVRSVERDRAEEIEKRLREPVGDEITPAKWTGRLRRWFKYRALDVFFWFLPPRLDRQHYIDAYSELQRHHQQRAVDSFAFRRSHLPPPIFFPMAYAILEAPYLVHKK